MLNRDRDIVTPFLQRGEQLLGAASISLAPGIPYPPPELMPRRQPSELEQKLGKKFNVLRRAYAVVNPVGAAVGAVEDRMMGAVPDSVWHGEGMAGGWHSAAGVFVRRMRDGTSSLGTFAVTDRRHLVVVDDSKLWQLKEQYALHWEAPRQAVALHRNPTGVLQRGRIDLHFADRSWAGITTPMPSTADELAAAAAHHQG
ncbi:hypothetical protein [Kitasatospora sp. DSM 101779]|uniref:hypothetical protein n=1 Tax=Kitasatospora sp. DSM 101779 TaxID=2853165 RepID=UPI0021D7E17F|nr:hypothetical protein [Kitasatospora sp. DSM 101779]MCU7825415.1 hypothetical protein [Kitasatospora sp. DSM 101779]